MSIIWRLPKTKVKEGDDIISSLINKIAKGDKNALKELYEEIGKDIYTFLLIYCKDRNMAEDALQETFITIYETAKSRGVFTNPKAWILTVAKNKVLNMLKKTSHSVSMESLEYVGQEYRIEDTAIDKMQTEKLLSVISPQDKEIVILHAVHGLKHREIAKITGLPLGTVTWRYKRSIEKMRNAGTENSDDLKEVHI